MPNLKTVIMYNMDIDTDAFRDIEPADLSVEKIEFQSMRGEFSRGSAIELSKALPDCKIYWDAELLSQDSKID